MYIPGFIILAIVIAAILVDIQERKRKDARRKYFPNEEK
jgi:hypothetical protein